MSYINSVKSTNPYGEIDDVLLLHINTDDDYYQLTDLIKLAGIYTFSIWYKSDEDGVVTFNLFGEIHQVTSTTNWQKFLHTVDIATLDNSHITISSSININTYFYEAFLSEGALDLSWTPAPEDMNDYVRSEIALATDNINLSVSQKLSESRDFIGVRYIRDWLNGSSILLEEGESDISNKWVECQVLVEEEDIASGIIPDCYDENLAEINIENLHPDVYTNEMLLEVPDENANIAIISEDGESADAPTIPLEEQYVELTGNHCLQIDLGSIRYDIDTIRIWHYYLNNDSYNHKLEISADGKIWTTLYDSNVSGSYVETESGKIYHFSNQSIDKSIAQIQMEFDEINLRVQNNANQFAEINLTTNSINSIVGDMKESQSALDNAIQSAKEMFDKEIQDIKDTYTTVVQTKEMIAQTVSDIDGQIKSQIILTEEGWKGKFAMLGMMGEDDPELQNNTHTYVSMSGDGLEVSSDDKTKKRTLVTKDGFIGYYDENEIFKLDEQGCWTGRAYISNGWETPGIKMIPIDYNNNGTPVKGVVYVKTGGAS